MPQAGLTLDCIGYRMFRVINFFVLPAFSKYRVRRQCLKMITLQKGKFLLATSCFDFLCITDRAKKTAAEQGI